MSGVNKVILIGHLGRDPELRYTNNGKSVCNFSIATSEKWTDSGGKKQERTEWHKIVAWSALADLCAKYLVKGSQVYIEGKLQTDNWEDKNGNKRQTTSVSALNVQFVGARKSGSSDDDEEKAPRDESAKYERDLDF